MSIFHGIPVKWGGPKFQFLFAEKKVRINFFKYKNMEKQVSIFTNTTKLDKRGKITIFHKF